MIRTLTKRTLLRKTPTTLMTIKRFINTVVMSFGDGSQGALGLPITDIGFDGDAYEPTRVPGLPSDISQVAAGHYHSLAVTSGGEIWAWGRNNEAQLGRELHASRDTWNEPKKVEGLDGVRVCSASASGVISAAIGDDGSLWVWGKSKRGQLGLGQNITEALAPAKVEMLSGEKIVKASFGWGHALALSEDGKLFGWGYSADGRIGMIGDAFEMSPLDSTANISKSNQEISSSVLEAAEQRVLQGIAKEKDMPIVWEPCFVKELHGVKVADVACGLDHALILCCNGTLLSCGSNVYSQLGRAKQDIGMHPVDISIRPTSIASGLGHCLAICEVQSSHSEGQQDCHVYTWGWNQSYQLGRAGPTNVPLVVETLIEEKDSFSLGASVSVSGGRVHSLALTSTGRVWVWGCGKNGRLGTGSSTDEVEPVWLYDLEDYKVLEARSGFDHNLLLVAEE